MSDASSRVGRALLVTVLAIATLGFGAMSLCGGYWTVVAIPALFAPGGGGAVMIFIISLPCLIGGFFMARLCARSLTHRESE